MKLNYKKMRSKQFRRFHALLSANTLQLWSLYWLITALFPRLPFKELPRPQNIWDLITLRNLYPTLLSYSYSRLDRLYRQRLNESLQSIPWWSLGLIFRRIYLSEGQYNTNSDNPRQHTLQDFFGCSGVKKTYAKILFNRGPVNKGYRSNTKVDKSPPQ